MDFLLSPQVALNVSWVVLVTTVVLLICGVAIKVRHHRTHH